MRFQKRIIAGYSFLFLLFILMLGLTISASLFVSYVASLAVLLGVALGVILSISLWLLRMLVRNPEWRQKLLILLIFLPLVVGIAVFLLILPGGGGGAGQGGGPPDLEPQVQEYKILVKPADPAELRHFEIIQTMRVGFEDSNVPNTNYAPLTFVKEGNRIVSSTKKGLLLREVKISSPQGSYTLLSSQESFSENIVPVDSLSVSERESPFDAQYTQLVIVGYCSKGICPPSETEPGEGTVSGILCSWDSCPRSEVELRDFPEGSFSGADNKEENPVHGEPYLGTVDITWPVADLKQPIVFAYMAEPYYRLPLVRTVLKPLEGVSSLGEAFFALLGILGGAVGGLVVFATGVVGGTLSDVVKEKLKALLAKLRSPKQRRRQDEAEAKENKENDHEEEQL